MFKIVSAIDLNKLIEKIKQYSPHSDLKIIEKAFKLGEKAHSKQFRKSGEPYFLHPFNVALFLADLNLDTSAIAAALLHDVIEDTEYTFQDIEKSFGVKIALLVDGVTKLSKLSFKSKMDRQAENLRKMLLAMIKDVRVILIKLADRLHNMMTLEHMPERKQREIANETIEIYAPIAHRLGINVIKSNLEDLALKILNPEIYSEIKRMIDSKKSERESFLKNIVNSMEKELKDLDINAKVTGRPKHFYSIYAKMKKYDKDFSEIYDLLAMRIVTDSVKDCYGALGIIHKLWKPLHGRFKDYIAVPKPNMYQSLHTTIIHPKGEPVEFQIRTSRMHQIAEEGIAAHWHYKQGSVQQQPKHDDESEYMLKLSWLKQLIEWHREVKDSQEFIEGIKVDLFQDEVFIFTPRGDIKVLSSGSNPIDFAYAIHTEVGHQCVGAKVNGKIVPLSHELNNGDVVDVLTSKRSTPSRDWLKFVKSQSAKNKIKAWFKKFERDDFIHRGKELLQEALIQIHREVKNEDIFSKNDTSLSKIIKSGAIEKAGKNYSFITLDEIFYQIGTLRLSPKNIINSIFPKVSEFKLAVKRKQTRENQKKRKKKKLSDGVKVAGIENMEVNFAKCCKPLPGDEIIGFITIGRGITVHRQDCYNMKFLREKPERLARVAWTKEDEDTGFFVNVKIKALDRRNLLQNVISLLTNEKINIYSAKAITESNDLAQLSFTFEIKNKSQLETLLSHIRKIPGIIDVMRVDATNK